MSKRAATFPLALSLARCGACTAQLTPAEQALFDEHVFGGPPELLINHDMADYPLLVRNGYVTQYDTASRVPKWVAYHVTPEYRDTPPREGKFETFRSDPDLPDPVSDADYNGWFARRGFARGHLAPYAVMGGDRDGNGVTAEGATSDDEHDVRTVFQSNYMSNVAPQHHNEFNGSGGLWFDLERWIQDDLVVDRRMEVWVIAGCVFGSGEFEVIGEQGAEDIFVPAMFYKIVVRRTDSELEPIRALAFLFPHQRSAHGDIEDFLVSIDVVEQMAGVDFFTALDTMFGTGFEDELEDIDTWDMWETFADEAHAPVRVHRRP